MLPSEKLQDAIIEFVKSLKYRNEILLFAVWLIFFAIYWFIAIFLLAPNFYSRNPIGITVLFSFGLAVGFLFTQIQLIFFSFKLNVEGDVFSLVFLSGIWGIHTLVMCLMTASIADYYIPLDHKSHTFLHQIPFFNFRFFILIVFSIQELRCYYRMLFPKEKLLKLKE